MMSCKFVPAKILNLLAVQRAELPAALRAELLEECLEVLPAEYAATRHKVRSMPNPSTRALSRAN